MSLTTTPKSASADSYVSVADADALLAGHPDVGDWTALTTAQKEWALKYAAKLMNQLQYQGSRTNDDQALARPRADVYYWADEMVYGSSCGQGNELNNDTIPEDIKMVQCLLALHGSQNDEFTDLKSINMGGLSVTKAGAPKWPPEIRMYLAPYLRNRNTNIVGAVRA